MRPTSSKNKVRPVVRPGYRFPRFLSRVGFKLYFRGRVFGLENVPESGGVMLVANHQSFLDPVVGALALRRECHFMARDSLFRNPLFGRLIAYLNAFPVKRGAADTGAVKEILRRLKDGQAVMVFPEGSRSRDGTIGPFNPNALLLAKKAGVPIVPTVIDGTFEALPRGCRWPRPHRVLVTYAEPIPVEQLQAASPEELLELLSRRLEAGLNTLRSVRRGFSAPALRDSSGV